MTIKEVSEKFNISSSTLRYYERVGMIPAVNRNTSGVRDYLAQDLAWVELAKCLRGAGLSVEFMTEYVRLYKEGDLTIGKRLDLLSTQRENLLEQKKQIDITLDRLNYKISKYEEAMESGKLEWGNMKNESVNS